MGRRKQTIGRFFTSSLFTVAAQAENEIRLVDDTISSEFYNVGDTVVIDGMSYCILSVNDKEVSIENIDFPLNIINYTAEQFLSLVGKTKKIRGYSPDDTELDRYIGAVYECNNRQYKIKSINNSDVVVEDLTMKLILNVTPEQTFTFDEVKPFLDSARLAKTDSGKSNSKSIEAEKNITRKQDKVSLESTSEQIASYADLLGDISENSVASDVETNVNTVNFCITEDEYYKTKGERIDCNIKAINILHTLQAENRVATPEEQKILAEYSGWGGLQDCFDENNSRYKDVLKLLSPTEYRDARASILTAYYTPVQIINLIYDVLIKAGFKGGRILEPSCGIGKFFGCLPKAIADNSTLYGVEIDNVSSQIAKHLYPNATIVNTGFESTKYSENLFDVCISNVPFGDSSPCDSKYNALNLSIHDYFICKMVDLVRPDGIVIAITSSYTMDKENNKARKYIAKRADLIGAVRLPDTAFKNSHTKPLSDILFFKKKTETDVDDSAKLAAETLSASESGTDTVNPHNAVSSERNWINVDDSSFENVPYKINSYYTEHPENIIGKKEIISSPYGPAVTISSTDKDEIPALPISFEYSERTTDVKDNATFKMVLPDELMDLPNFTYVELDNNIWFRENEMLTKAEFNKTAKDRVKALIPLRDILLNLISAQVKNKSDDEIKSLQEKLSYLYDTFVHRFGRISSRANSLAFRDDSKYPLLCSLEIFDDDNNFVSKADIFTKRTIKIERTPAADNPSDALAISIAEKGGIDFEYMQELTGKSKEEIISVLLSGEEIFKVPAENNLYETRSRYLTGYVKEKLKVARLAAEKDSVYKVNVEALEKVQPKDIPYNEIYVTVGSTWIPIKYYEEFMHYLLETPEYAKGQCRIVFINDKYHITDKSICTVKSRDVIGTPENNGYELLEDCLNLISTRVYDYYWGNGNQKSKINSEKTQIVQTKQEEIRQKFLDWIWNDLDRRDNLVRIYNDQMNNLVECDYDGSKIRFVGMNSSVELMEHQKNAVARIIYEGNTLLAHVVGAGKTFTMIAAAMEKKRLGLCNKSLFVVPNHLVEQWAGEFARLYPFANVLITSKKDFSKQNRKKFCSKIATGYWDAVIVSHEQFKAVPLSVERQEMEINKQIEEIDYVLSELNDMDNFSGFTVKRYSIKQKESEKKKLQDKLKKLLDSPKDDTVYFEDLGIDCLFLDEAHMFKNLAVYTKLNNVAGLTNANSKKASELLMKTNYLNEITGYKGVVFATGTPISNAICELYVMQKYLQEKDLHSHGIYSFDSWISRFAETENKVEVKPEGTGYRTVTRVCKYHNLPELINIFKLVADIRVADQLNLDVPKRRDHNIAVNPSEVQVEIVKSFGDRAEDIRNRKVDRQEDNMLCVTNDGRKLAIDARLYDNRLEDDKKSKLNRMTRTVYKIWKRTQEFKAAQLIFSDLGTPKKNSTNAFDVYNDIKAKLISFGVPKEEIAFIHDANTDAKKKVLYEKVNKGDVRVLIGSTEKLGAGTNVQKRLIAIHNLDCPWRPSDLEQRAGRIIRQGNMFKTVYIYSYVTKNTFDTYLYQTVLNKAEPIAQIMSSKKPQRDLVDIDTACLNYAEIKALSTGNPEIKEKMELEEKVAKLKILRSNYVANKFDLENKIKVVIPHEIEALKAKLFAINMDLESLNDYPLDDNNYSPITIDEYTITDKKEAGIMLLAKLATAKVSEEKIIGSYRGFEISIKYDMRREIAMLYINSHSSHYSYPVEMGEDAFGNIIRINNVLSNLPKGIEKITNVLNQCESDLENAKMEYEKPFSRETEYQESVERLRKLNAKLAVEGSTGVENLIA